MVLNRGTTLSYSSTSNKPRRDSTAVVGLHGERLHKIVVFELRDDGTTEYSTMTLRALYNYVVRTITEACREANKHDHGSKRKLQQQQYHSSNNVQNNNASSSTDNHTTSRIDVIKEEVDSNIGGSVDTYNYNNTNESGSSPNPTTPSSPYPPTTPHGLTTTIPPHLPSLTSSHATPLSGNSDQTNSLPTPIVSNTESHNNSSNEDHQDHSTQQQQQQHGGQRQQRTKQLHLQYPETRHHPPQRETQTAFTPLPNNNTHRERLGGYLHPRDMRRLVTPFSSSNEPQLMVRRHVMLLNFDPLRAIVLRDRLLILVPDGADSILIALERRVRGGIAEMEDQVFGKTNHDHRESVAVSAVAPTHIVSKNIKEEIEYSNMDSTITDDTVTDESAVHESLEWEDIQKMDWKHMPYELQSVDAVMQTVLSMLMDDARKVHQRSSRAMGELRGEHKGTGLSGGEHAQERLRLYKDEVNLMEGRVQGFVRALNEILDDDEDMTLMNLSRLISHPERFLQPVSKEILHEESDEPELILEAYLQQALSIVNELDLLKGQITTTEEQISMTLDAIRNRLLYINTLLSVASLCVSLGSFIGSIFGMNLTNHLETQPTAFIRVTVGTIVGMICMWVILSTIFFKNAPVYDYKKKV